MTDKQIESLKELLKREIIYWIPDDSTAERIVSIGPGPKPEPGDVEEPSECAYLMSPRHQYVALYNVSLSEFSIVHPIAATPPGQRE